ncbi:hypothetical protein [Flavobacterium sp.]|uniref:hypothetical protein n=1 Tax=Flavobacterium sp. TaxID=239 RepID=UPI00286E7A38|nr:hypothetical protein [Flavobacterium sp.]
MKNHAIVPYATENYLSFLKELKESILYSKLQYTSFDLQLINDISNDEIDESIKNAISICHLVGIESKYHFKKIYVFDVDYKIINTEWRMSKKGFNLVVMQFQKLNQKKAIWLWKLADN